MAPLKPLALGANLCCVLEILIATAFLVLDWAVDAARMDKLDVRTSVKRVAKRQRSLAAIRSVLVRRRCEYGRAYGSHERRANQNKHTYLLTPLTLVFNHELRRYFDQVF